LSVGRHNGYFDHDDSIIEQINASDANILFVAMDSPLQELWIHEHMDQIDANFLLGVGGTFDIISGRIKSAPAWMQKIGLEFFYRFCQFPTR
jgi:N-acetylglucosaminyldiphosphoundecaprenol N-acetyl-beta-D-mannosaminyltransferase